MKKLKIIFISFIFLICTSYNQNTKLTLEEETLEIKKSLDKTEQGLIEINKILNDPYYKYKSK
jgi:hypothetical protein